MNRSTLRHVRTLIVMLSAVVLAPRALAASPVGGSDVVSAIETHPGESGGTVVLKGTTPPVFSVFRLSSPDRIVVDLAGADVSKVTTPGKTGIEGLTDISAVQFQKGETRVGRVVLGADPALRYDVKVAGNDVVVTLAGEQRKADAVDAKPEAKPTAAPIAPEAAAPVSVKVADAAPMDAHLLERLVDDGQGKASGRRILSATAGSGKTFKATIKTDGTVGQVVMLRLKDPNRVAVDLTGFGAKGAKAQAGGIVSGVRFGGVSGGARVVFDLDEEAPKLTLHRGPSGLSVVAQVAAPTSAAIAQAPAKVEAKPAVKPEPVPASTAVAVASKPTKASATTPAATPTATPAAPVPAVAEASLLKHARATPKAMLAVSEVRDLRVTGEGATQQIVLDLPNATKLGAPTKVSGGGYELRLPGVAVPERLRRTLDATAFGGPVSTVSSFNIGQDEGRVVVSAAAGTTQELKQDGHTVTWQFSAAKAEPPAEVWLDGNKITSDVHTEQESSQVAGFTTAAAEGAAASPGRAHYTGRRISLEFYDIEIQNLLRLFADISHKNVVVADDVKGKVTIALRNVPWDQAFDLILKTHGLGKEELGNIIRVAPEAELEKEHKSALDAQKARALLEPLRVRLIPVNYAIASDVSDKIKDVLSERGVVTVDGRTNVLIVKDIAENLAKAEGMVRNLDTQTPQVLIESRIVEASTQFNRQVGIQWGGNAGFSPVTANSTGLIFPNTATVAGAAGGSPNSGTAATPNYAINLPAAIGQGVGGGLGFIFGSAGGALNLNLRISALEANGVVKTVSAPKVATLDNQEAAISQGVSIPFAQVSAAGVQTSFVEARLELKVTPHVTSDGSVLLKINATNNQPNAGITGSNGQPSISRKEAKTQMLVKDGDTTVIGGIYTRATGVSINQVPLFGSIPILGWLFKNRSDTDSRTELLIFITPRILNRQQIVASGN